MAQGYVFQHELLARLEPGAQDTEDRQNQVAHGQTTWLASPKNQPAWPATEFSLPSLVDFARFGWAILPREGLFGFTSFGTQWSFHTPQPQY
jgi:hypothetical protein